MAYHLNVLLIPLPPPLRALYSKNNTGSNTATCMSKTLNVISFGVKKICFVSHLYFKNMLTLEHVQKHKVIMYSSL